MKYDKELSIATGKSRFEKLWKNKKITWSSLIDRLRTPIKTQETYVEYKKMAKTSQDNIKDVGGYVGGKLKEGKRSAGSVLSRSILTLDLDFAPIDIFDTLELLADYACCIYSTHKHSLNSPRFRLLVPLDRDVSPDEYEAISRKLAEEIGIDYFDDTTYQPSRLMYWPSCSADGTYYFNTIDNPFLSADKMLARYEDWTDISFWPESSRAAGIRKRSADKQEDPCSKGGLIGAFCRTYSVPEVIDKFLPDVYVKCEAEGRYTYTGGSTAAGLVIYEDGKFAYSNHGTDPISGKLCNAFDLIRIHKFGDRDEEAKEGTPVNKLPSYQAMTNFITSDDETKITLGHERMDKARDEFSTSEVDEEDSDWVTKLELDKQGVPKPTIENVRLILTNDPVLKGISGYNEFDFKTTILKNVPWRKAEVGDTWQDTDDAGLLHYLECTYEIYTPKKTEEALDIVQHQNKFHPIRDYLDGLPEWDGIERLDCLFIDYLGAEDSLYTRAVTRKALTAAVGRIYQPGIKFDNMITLVGPQGVGKSYILKVLGKEWYSDSLITVQGKEAYESLHGTWILEMAELTAAKKAEVEAVKHFISKQEDIYRAAYARRSMNFPRQCIFVGTTNDNEFLRDRTGNRRFWPIEVSKDKATKDVFKELPQELDQMWSEAKFRWINKEPLHLNAELSAMAQEKQEEYTERDSRQGIVEDFLEMELPVDWSKMDLWAKRTYIDDYDEDKEYSGPTEKRRRVCALEIWIELFGKDSAGFNKMVAREINAMLDRINGWEKEEKVLKFPSPYGVQRGYKKVTFSE